MNAYRRHLYLWVIAGTVVGAAIVVSKWEGELDRERLLRELR